MKSPFPGMDPYLEAYWGDVHTSLITYARDALQAALPGRYFARAEERVCVESEESEGRNVYPDVHVVEYPNDPRAEAGGAVAVTETVETEPITIHGASEPATTRYIEIIDARSGNRVVTAILPQWPLWGDAQLSPTAQAGAEGG